MNMLIEKCSNNHSLEDRYNTVMSIDCTDIKKDRKYQVNFTRGTDLRMIASHNLCFTFCLT